MSSRILLISVHGDPTVPIGAEGAGGQNVYVREVATRLAARGHSVDVATRLTEPGDVRVEVLSPRLRVVRVPCGPPGYVGRDRLFPHLAEFVARLGAWASSHAPGAYSVIHSNYWLSGWVGLRMARLLRVPQTHTSHSLGWVKLRADCGNVLDPPQSRMATAGRVTTHLDGRLEVEREIVREADAIIATCPDEADNVVRFYGRPSRLVLIPCGYDPRVFRPLPRRNSRSALGLPADRPLILFAGRLVPMKGVDTLIEAAAVLRLAYPAELVVVGGYVPGAADEEEYLRLRYLATRLGLGRALSWRGAADHATLARYYSAVDAVAVPSHYESFGMVAVEAMACATPVVVSGVGGLGCNVDHGVNGLHARPRDVPAFVRALATVVSNPRLARAMGREGARKARSTYTWDLVVDRLERLYQSLQPAGRRR